MQQRLSSGPGENQRITVNGHIIIVMVCSLVFSPLTHKKWSSHKVSGMVGYKTVIFTNKTMHH